MTSLTVVLIGNFEAAKQSLLDRFIRDKIPNLYHRTDYLIVVSEEEYSLLVHDATSVKDESRQRTLYQLAHVFICIFSVVDPDSFKALVKVWIPNIKKYISHIPIILVGTNAELRTKKSILEKLSLANEQPISTRMGKLLASRIKAVEYMELSGDERAGLKGLTNLENLLKKAVWAPHCHLGTIQREVFRPFKIIVVGYGQNSGKSDMIRQFVFGERLNICDERINEQPFFYYDGDKKFSTNIEIDGQEYALDINDNLNLACNDDIGRLYTRADIIMFVFSVVEPECCKGNFTSLKVLCMHHWQLSFGTRTILVGNKTNLRSDLEVLDNLSRQRLKPTTFEIGEQLANTVKAVKYVECCSIKGTNVENVFKEAVWASLRHYEGQRPKASPRKSSRCSVA